MVGRAQGCDIHVNLPHISATHCSLRPSGYSEEGHYIVKLMDTSSNGTCHNGLAIGRNNEVDLRDGDTITFTKMVGQITDYPRMIWRACAIVKSAPTRRAKRARGGEINGSADAAAAEAGAAAASAAAAALEVERKEVARLQKELASEREKAQRAQEVAAAKEAELREAQRAAQRAEVLRFERSCLGFERGEGGASSSSSSDSSVCHFFFFGALQPDLSFGGRGRDMKNISLPLFLFLTM